MKDRTTRVIIGDIRYTLSNRLKDRYPEVDGPRGFTQTTEAYLVKTISGVDLKGQPADYYIAPGDGGGPIAVRVNAPADEIWNDIPSTDGEAVRLLSVKSDGSFSLGHPRDTQFEQDLLAALEAALA